MTLAEMFRAEMVYRPSENSLAEFCTPERSKNQPYLLCKKKSDGREI